MEKPLRDNTESLRKIAKTAAVLLGQNNRLYETFGTSDLEESRRGTLLRAMRETVALLVGEAENAREALSKIGIGEYVRKRKSMRLHF